MKLLDDPLPAEGLLCVEASAGTGKTHLLATLAARWLVEAATPPSALLVVTFTVAAARELRSRVRGRLVEVRRRLAGQEGDASSDLSWLDRAGPPDVLSDRVEHALTHFDAITISTIHAFAGGAMGVEAAMDQGELRRVRATADALARAAFVEGQDFLSTERAQALFARTVRLALDNPDAALQPDDAAVASPEAAGHANAVAEAVEACRAQCRRDAVRSFADLLAELDAALDVPGSPLRHTLRERYAVGLIDEFQDTDPLQWRIFRRVFLEAPGHVLCVVGDPKQAVYGFRGADVSTYLEARGVAAEPEKGGLGVAPLRVNHRADPAMLLALNALFEGTTLDEDGRIAYQAVVAPDGAPDSRLELDGVAEAPLSLRLADLSKSAPRRRAIAAECAREARRLLDAGTVPRRGGREPLAEQDFVVLCATRGEFPRLREAFRREGIRTTESKSDDVLASDAVNDLEVALAAMRDPLNPGLAAAVANSWLGEHADRDGGARRLVAQWNEVLAERGPAALARAITDPQRTPGLLARRGGERLVTDVHHLCDVLLDSAPPGAGPDQLIEVLHDLQDAGRDRTEEEVRARRIDTDQPAVRFMTVHAAKGLEFPVVLCPFVTSVADESAPVLWRDAASGTRELDAAGLAVDWDNETLDAATKAARTDVLVAGVAGERRRLLYVALTRAKHRTVVWWDRSGSAGYRNRDELASLLFDRDEEGRPLQRRRRERAGADAYHVEAAEGLVRLARHLAPQVDAGLIELAAAVPPGDDRATSPTERAAALERPALSVAALDRALSVRPQRCSFSSLVSAHEAVTSIDEVLADAGAEDEGAADEAEAADAATDPFGGHHGTRFGSAVHEALEAALLRDPTTSFADALATALAPTLERWGVDDDPVVAEGLLRAARAPIAGASSLEALSPRDASPELRFQLPVAPGVTLHHVADAVAAAEPRGPYAPWARSLRDGPATPLAATLVGSIDLLTTLGTAERYSVIDYKTNLVADADYRDESLRRAMVTADYPLQAILYLVAVHRLLRWRLAGYDPARHLGGAHYLFLRGMGDGAGVASWTPPERCVLAVSDLLAGAR